MSYQTMTIGASPCEESCAQVGHPGYEARSRRECLVFRRMLERLFPLADDVPARFAVISSPHEFGTYREVCVRYEDNTPAQWDAIARYELIWIERKDQLQRAVLRGDLQPQEVPTVYRGNGIPDLPADHSFSELLTTFPL